MIVDGTTAQELEAVGIVEQSFREDWCIFLPRPAWIEYSLTGASLVGRTVPNAVDVMAWSQDTDDYDRIRGRHRPPRRRLLVVLFDLFYPILVAIIVIAILCWHLDLPPERLLRGAISDLLKTFG